MNEIKQHLVTMVLLALIIGFGWNAYTSHQRLVEYNARLIQDNTRLQEQYESLKKDLEVREKINQDLDVAISTIEPKFKELGDRITSELVKEQHAPTPPRIGTNQPPFSKPEPIPLPTDPGLPVEILAAWDAYCLTDKESASCTATL